MIRRGQLSIFLIVVLVLVLVFLLASRLGSKDMYPAELVPQQKFEPYFFFLENCLKEKAKESIREIALHGGYSEVPEPSLNFLYFDYPFYIFEGEFGFPEKNDVEMELAKLYSKHSQQCYQELLGVANAGLQFSLGKTSSEASIVNNSVILNIKYPITINDSQSKESKGSFSFNIESELNRVYSAAEEFMSLEKESTDALCWTCLSDVSEKFDVHIGMENPEEGTVLFSFIYNSTNTPVS